MGAGGRGYVCVTREITQRREAETNTTAMMLEITARHEMQLSALLSASFAVALLVTPDSTTLHLSDSARDELGLTTSADDPTPLSELSLAIPHADIEQLHAVLTSARVEGPSTVRVTWHLPTKLTAVPQPGTSTAEEAKEAGCDFWRFDGGAAVVVGDETADAPLGLLLTSSRLTVIDSHFLFW